MFTAPSGRRAMFESGKVQVASGEHVTLRVPYSIEELCTSAYGEYRGTLQLHSGGLMAASELWFDTWTTPIDLELARFICVLSSRNSCA